MNVILTTSILLSALSHAQAPLQINTDTKTGDVISGEKDFRVTVQTPDGVSINQVEFYVGDELRDTATSTPYIFPFDTIDLSDEDVNIRFKAYTTQSKTIEKKLSLHIDNQKSKGADFHVQAATDDLTNSKYKEAVTEGRIALNIDPQNEGAKIALARGNLGLNVFDKAQKYAQDAATQDPKNTLALSVLATVDVRRAFNTFSKGDADKGEVIATMGEALSQAVTARRKSLDLAVDAIGDATDANAIQLSDAANSAERYSLTRTVLTHRFEADPGNAKIASRLAYAQLRSGRYQEALNTLDTLRSHGQMDAYNYALLAILLTQVGKTADGTAAMKNAIEADPDNLGVRTAEAFIALKQNKTSVLAGIATDLAKDQGQRPSVNYFLMALDDRQQQYSAARKAFETAVLAEPCYPDLYIEQGNSSIQIALDPNTSSTEKDRAISIAKMYYQTAQIARPEAVDALAGMMLVSLLQKNVQDAVRFGEAARNTAPDSGAGHYALAAAYQAAGRYNDAHAEVLKAGQLDQPNLQGRSIPDALAVWRYLVSGGRIPVVSPPQG